MEIWNNVVGNEDIVTKEVVNKLIKQNDMNNDIIVNDNEKIWF
jgi:hypothetical protein